MSPHHTLQLEWRNLQATDRWNDIIEVAIDSSPMWKNKSTNSKTMKSKKKSLHVKMIHQVTQLQMQSIDEENSKYFISSHKHVSYCTNIQSKEFIS